MADADFSPSLDSELHIEADIITCQPGDVLHAPGMSDKYVYEIREGLIKIFTLNDHNHQSIHIIYGQGELFPLTWMVGQKLQDAYAEAVGEAVLKRYDKQKFVKAITTDLPTAVSIIGKLTAQLHLYASRLDNLGFRYASERLAYRLLFLGYRFGVRQKQAVKLPNFTNQEIGQMINLSRESVNRELARFVRLGLVENRAGALWILNEEGLSREVSKDTKLLFARNPIAR